MQTATRSARTCPACGRNRKNAIRCRCSFFDQLAAPSPPDEVALEQAEPATPIAGWLGETPAEAAESSRHPNLTALQNGVVQRVAVETLATVRDLKKRRLLGPYPRSTVVAVMPSGALFARCVYPHSRDATQHGTAMHDAGWTVVEEKPAVIPKIRKLGVEVLWWSEGDQTRRDTTGGGHESWDAAAT